MKFQLVPLLVAVVMIILFLLFWFVLDDRDPFLFFLLGVAGVALFLSVNKNPNP
jgi:hypothetical protein